MTPYWDNGIVQLHHGDARDVLAQFEAESVHCCISSPPYWGLRDYNLEPTVWGGDADHAHEWGSIGPGHHPGQVPDGKAVTDENAVGQNAGSGRNCACGAWLGTLGLEPTPDCGKQGFMKLRRDLTPVQREYVAQRLAGVAAPDVESNDKGGRESLRSRGRSADQGKAPKA